MPTPLGLVRDALNAELWSGPKLLLAVIASKYDCSTRLCRVTNAELATMTGITDQQVVERLLHLEGVGAIQRGNGPGVWSVHLPLRRHRVGACRDAPQPATTHSRAAP